MNSHPEIEDELCRHYQLQVVHFQRAMQACETVTRALREQADVHDAVAQLNSQLDEIAVLETATRKLQHRWRRSGQKPGLHLNATIRDVAEVVKRLIDCLDVAETLARRSRDALRPAIAHSNRVEQMRQAYQQTSDG
ncbi:MAG: hypothetical protein EA424_12645 [Planctomycetaceae bacterium]|jgi:ABC-type transporter Mla subunit MlaD|nr:MAG: hypothetical protein EA424_12645 [Planctomycetaceae bacterium]